MVGAVAAAAVAVLVIPGVRDRLPAGTPLLGPTANSVYEKLRAAGLPITDGEPADPSFRRMVRRNSCASSRSFVRTDTADVGWGFICVDPPRDAYQRMSRAMDGVPLLIGPLFVDDGGGEVIIFGIGWPVEASRKMYRAIGASGGTYLVKT